ncbi:efflux RND transporter periplasmic adaptor subunit [Loktanella sp. R86503]|uniref:efflux RND transporter periplasmic adaptor subunit n=1 Tax=Loktanella sp. R86503 TaxID=3093847 RepID=UPI0036DAA222
MRQQILTALLACTLAMPVAAQSEAPFVKLETVTSRAATEQRVFFGRVVARETVDLAFQVGGQIEEFPVEEGATVKAGDLVARMDQVPFELALAQATAQKAQADRTVNRYRELVGSSVSETTLQDADTQAELADIAVRDAQRNLANATLHAPFDGIVAARTVPNYSTVAAGSSVVRLHDMSDLRIEIDVPETLFQSANRNADMEIFAQFPSNDGTYPLELREYNAETAQIGQTYSITLGMTPPDDLSVLPGASAKVTAILATGKSGIIVPSSAVIVENDKSTSVMVFTPTGANAGTVMKTPVNIAPTDNGDVMVIDGLTAGQEIVVVGGSALTDGDSVRRFAGFGN